MPLPTPNLDDLRFQKNLVDEARKRIVQYCPEWTDYNLSDPGITLIELFAWMTELTVYRLNRVPDKNYIKFLELLGLQMKPASSARTDLTFWLSVSLPISEENQQSVHIPRGFQVRSDSPEMEEIVFSTDRDLEIYPPKFTQLRKPTEVNKNYHPRLGVETFYPFDRYNPKEGDTFYIGFDPSNDLKGHILRLFFTCEPTEAVGIRREDPPWVWEVSLGDSKWQEIPLSSFQGEKDTTGGLNNPTGSLVLYLPLEAKPEIVSGQNAMWLRCRIEQRNPSQGMYTESPRVIQLDAYSIGATVPATHALTVDQEYLGISSGEAGQSFTLEQSPVLALKEDETILVEEFRNGENVQVPWKHVHDFSKSSRFDRHFTLDEASGLITFGPSVRQSDGSVIQYGRIPESGRSIYFSSYRYGGGAKGNLPINNLQSMSSSLAYVSRVSNLIRASGGRDQEDLEEVKLRAQRELQAQKRAVTAQDFEQLALDFSRTIARVKCITPSLDRNQGELGIVELLVIPAIFDSLAVGDNSRLHVKFNFIEELQNYLDQFRLLTTHVRVKEPEYVGIQVKAKIVVEDYSNPSNVVTRVHHHLVNFLNPLVPFPESEQNDHLLESGWIGWPFGKSLFSAEIYSLIQRVPGVKYVLDAEIFSRPVNPKTETNNIDEQPPALLVKEKMIWVPENALVCSLDHEVSVVDLADIQRE
ncbi:MAG TPA: putative baseplate assembly protein [Anaerolineaceae bacterium]|nr:putative baseplate assembly protein [Anaerolineaceae bacterium]